MKQKDMFERKQREKIIKKNEMKEKEREKEMKKLIRKINKKQASSIDSAQRNLQRKVEIARETNYRLQQASQKALALATQKQQAKVAQMKETLKKYNEKLIKRQELLDE